MLKTKVVNIIAARAPDFISGQALAEQLNVSRNAVWKAVNELKTDGYIIEAVARRGYRLSPKNKKLCAAELLSYTDRIEPILYDSLESTNITARQKAQNGARAATAVLAESQTGGKGRMGRSFFSPQGGIYMSIVLRPQISLEKTLFITVAAAVAAAESIEAVSGKKSEIKWVNDIYIDGKKVCGILTEGAICAETSLLDYAILGIGINTDCPQADFPEELQARAGSVFDKTAASWQKARLIGEFCNRFFDIYKDLDNKEYIREYQHRSFLDGKTVQLLQGGRSERARALRIDDEARLVVEKNGEIFAVASGDVQLEGFFE